MRYNNEISCYKCKIWFRVTRKYIDILKDYLLESKIKQGDTVKAILYTKCIGDTVVDRHLGMLDY